MGVSVHALSIQAVRRQDQSIFVDTKSEGARERGSERARERESEGARERESERARGQESKRE